MELLSKPKDFSKWNIWTTPPTMISMMPKWRVFAPSRLHHCFWGKGLIVPFYSAKLVVIIAFIDHVKKALATASPSSSIVN